MVRFFLLKFPIRCLRSTGTAGFVVILVGLFTVVGGATNATKESVYEYVAFIHSAAAAAAAAATMP